MINNKNTVRSIVNFLVFISFFSGASCQKPNSEEISWDEKQIEPGLLWKHAQTDKLFESKQNINILEIDTRKRSTTLVYNRNENVITSKLAREAGAIAAVNAGFFDMANGGSVTYIKVDGIVNEEDSTKWKRIQNLNGALIIKADSSLDIELAGEYQLYTSNIYYDDVLVTGCLLIDDGKRVSLSDNSFVNSRHPRTCVGILSNHKVLLITVDGRSEQAQGMSLHELTDFMALLGCQDAINLDGGGSTTMWMKGFGETGVVNMPSDNQQFDHAGERAVSNVLVIK